ncbi:MAG: arginine--tRNA ligase [Bacteroidales bacterium]|jgi:arginyl-tRNA synthetase
MITNLIVSSAKKSIEKLYNEPNFPESQLVVQPTKEGIDGDFTLVVFPISRVSKKKPAETAEDLGNFILEDVQYIESYSVINGFLNFKLKSEYWNNLLNQNFKNINYGYCTKSKDKKILIEFSSPNTNKPLHLGHVRNNLIGMSVANLLDAAGYDVVKLNLVNDRGVHICKSMYAWQKWGNGSTPESTGIKGDHLVGDYYVEFAKHCQEEVAKLIENNISEEEAKKNAPSIKAAQQMLSQWENNDKEVIDLWKIMNNWVYDGFDITYKRLGINFDKTYYESETYLLGKKIVEDALQKGIVYKEDDSSVWIDLTDEGLDKKLLLRGDGTSVYMTQDIGTAILRFNDYSPNKMIYVVGNEQIYHFDVLKQILKKFGYNWWNTIYHLSYGMVELTTGKMKSREGTVVDADDLMDEMNSIASQIIKEQGKIEYGTKEADELAEIVGLAALKYYILKVDPKKQMLFDPKESIDFNGNTGPFVQYTYARIQSLLSKANFNEDNFDYTINKEFSNYQEEEIALIKMLHDFPNIVQKAANDLNPGQIANFVYELAKCYNRFYQSISVLKENDPELKNNRILLSYFTANVIRNSMHILTIEVPDRM